MEVILERLDGWIACVPAYEIKHNQVDPHSNNLDGLRLLKYLSVRLMISSLLFGFM